MKKYNTPIVEIVDATDIVTTSGEVETEKISFIGNGTNPTSTTGTNKPYYGTDDFFEI